MTNKKEGHLSNTRVASSVSERRSCLVDLVETARSWRLWWRLSWRDVRSRYRQTMLGPLWTVMGNAMMIGGMGLVYGYLWGIEASSYLPYFSGGYIVWSFLLATVTEACQAFVLSGDLIKSSRLPYSGHVLRILMRNSIVFLHNIPLHVGVCLFFGVGIGNAGTLFLPFGVGLVLANLAWLSMILAIACAKFRDISPLTTIGLQLSFFITPIIWHADRVRSNPVLEVFLVQANPLHALIDVIRAPLLGEFPSAMSVVILISAGFIGSWVALAVLHRTRHKIAYWL